MCFFCQRLLIAKELFHDELLCNPFVSVLFLFPRQGARRAQRRYGFGKNMRNREKKLVNVENVNPNITFMYDSEYDFEKGRLDIVDKCRDFFVLRIS